MVKRCCFVCVCVCVCVRACQGRKGSNHGYGLTATGTASGRASVSATGKGGVRTRTRTRKNADIISRFCCQPIFFWVFSTPSQSLLPIIECEPKVVAILFHCEYGDTRFSVF